MTALARIFNPVLPSAVILDLRTRFPRADTFDLAEGLADALHLPFRPDFEAEVVRVLHWEREARWARAQSAPDQAS